MSAAIPCPRENSRTTLTLAAAGAAGTPIKFPVVMTAP
jgi:hypothetical protein